MKPLLGLDLKKLGVIDWGHSNNSRPITFKYFEKWKNQGLDGPLGYMSDHRFDIRSDLFNFFPNFSQSLTFLFSYNNPLTEIDGIAKYATAYNGVDYHFELKDRLNLIIQEISKSIPDVTSQICLDVHPVLERDLAYRSGLGFFGKNSMLISKDKGSFFLICSILFDKRIIEDIEREVEIDHCGSCTKCIDMCPTDAIVEDKFIDASKCISTFTIETFKEAEPPAGYAKQEYFFGCDICQNVCPWNNEKKINTHQLGQQIYQQEFLHHFKQDKSSLMSWLKSISNREYKKVLKGSVFERTGRVGMLKNIK